MYYSNNFYWGKLLKVFCDDKKTTASQVVFAFLRYQTDGYYDYPSTEVDVRFVFYGPATVLKITKGKGFKMDQAAVDRYTLIKKLHFNLLS